MIKQNITRRSTSPWASRVVLVPKPGGKIRMCIGFRKLNSVNVKDSYPLSRVNDILDSLCGSQFFTTLDLFSGYHQTQMEEQAKEKK